MPERLPPVVAVDIGGTKIAAGLVVGGSVVGRSTVPTPGRAGDVVDAVASAVTAWAGAGTVAVATTGWVRDGVVLGPNRGVIEGWYGFELRSALQWATRRTVRLYNDGVAAAWGEYRHGAARGEPSSLFVTVSTGVGGGIVIDDRSVLGSSGFAGHVGHVVVDPDGPACGCGRRGCLEVTASGRAIERRAFEAVGERLEARTVLERAAAGDEALEVVLAHAVRCMRRGLGDLQAVLAPHVVVLGGGVGSNPCYRRRLLAAVDDEPEPFRPNVRPARLGHDAALVGAADLSLLALPQVG